jgi:hypothetical protein
MNRTGILSLVASILPFIRKAGAVFDDGAGRGIR